MKSASVYRRTNKPLMEKKRRARINESLLQLKTLVLDTMQSDPMQYSKLEKADILELTVAHLVRQQRHLAAEGSDSVSKYAIGFNECANEVVRYLSEDNLGVRPEVRSRVLNHLANCINTSRYMKRLDNHQGNSSGYVPEESLENVSTYPEDLSSTSSFEATRLETDCISNNASPGLANVVSPEHSYIPEVTGIPKPEPVGFMEGLNNNDLNFGIPVNTDSTIPSSSASFCITSRQSPSVPNEDYFVHLREESFSSQNIQRQKRSPAKFTERQTLPRNEMNEVPKQSRFSSVRHTYKTGHLPFFKSRHENSERQSSFCDFNFQRTGNNEQNMISGYQGDGRTSTQHASPLDRLSPPEIFPYSRSETTICSEKSLKQNNGYDSQCNVPTSALPSQSSVDKRPPLGALRTVESSSWSNSRQRVSYSMGDGQEQKSGASSYGDMSFGILNFGSNGVWRPW